ncbi:MAG TPA: hypothetical protein VKU40_03790, partial [Thermoanaerobaculia bacterium]|nr:hypothetical protein [Thermoanaerobaculia bacterium]
MRTSRTLAFVLAIAALVALPALSAQATIIVGCTGTPTTDGSNLISIYNGATAPEVVQPSPCDYDLGTATLNMQTGVDLAGLSRNTTLIRSQNNTAGQGTITVPSGADVEIRNLAIETDSVNAVAIDNSSALLVIEDVNLTATGEENATAIFTDARMRGFDVVAVADVDGEEVISAIATGIDDDSDSVFSDTLVIAGGAACTEATGIAIDNSDTTLDEVSIFVSCGGDATGIDVVGGSGGSQPLIANAKIFVSSNSADAVGIGTSGSDNFTRVRDALIEADGGDNSYGALKTGALTLQLVDVQALAL